MRLLLAFMLMLSTSAFAQRAISRDSFMVNVRPVLSGILGDFYQMVTLFPDFPKELGPLIQELNTLTPEKEILKTSCPRVLNIKCRDSIDAIRGKLQKVKSLSLLLQARQKLGQTPYVNSLAATRVVAEFDNELDEVKGLLDNASFLIRASINQKKETYLILRELDELNTIISLAVVENIPFFYQEDFRHFYNDFIHPLQQQISKNNNHEFLNRNIIALNFAINLLNQTLTKKKKTPEGMGPYLSTMHNRWNSLLRYYF